MMVVDSFAHRDGTPHTGDGPIGCPGCGFIRTEASKLPQRTNATGAYYGPASNCPKRPWLAYVNGKRLNNARGVGRRFSTQAAALRAIEELPKEDPEIARIRAMIEELPADCSHCKKTAYVTAEERSRGKWNCYSCGTINRWAAKEKS